MNRGGYEGVSLVATGGWHDLWTGWAGREQKTPIQGWATVLDKKGLFGQGPYLQDSELELAVRFSQRLRHVWHWVLILSLNSTRTFLCLLLFVCFCPCHPFLPCHGRYPSISSISGTKAAHTPCIRNHTDGGTLMLIHLNHVISQPGAEVTRHPEFCDFWLVPAVSPVDVRASRPVFLFLVSRVCSVRICSNLGNTS
jgi:hypothetical protein